MLTEIGDIGTAMSGTLALRHSFVRVVRPSRVIDALVRWQTLADVVVPFRVAGLVPLGPAFVTVPACVGSG